jgi:hypothetical protein
MPELHGKVLRCYMNWLALSGMTAPAEGYPRSLQAAGYEGIQLVDSTPAGIAEEARTLGLGVCGSGRVNAAEDADRIARAARDQGLECVTLHVGWGLEDDDEMDRLIGAVLDAAVQHGVPLYPETHRATIFQDMWRTVRAIERFPELRFNCDFSHWYTGLEMVYGTFERKLQFIQPVIERGRFVHGRIGDPGSIQVDVGDGDGAGQPYVEHFRIMWTAVFASFLASTGEGDTIYFATELLPHDYYYARRFNGLLKGQEESDRWQQSLVLMRIARECFATAERSALTGVSAGVMER